MRRRPLVAVSIVAALVLAAGVAAWLVVIRDDPDPVEIEDVLAGLEGESGAGVYVYETEGGESVDALLGSAHDYPARTTIAVSAGGCGLLLRWAPLEGRSQTYEICQVAGGFELAGYRETHTFLGQTTRTEYRCEPGSPWLLTGEERFERRCATGETAETARGRLEGPVEVTVSDTTVDTYHVRLDTTLEGSTNGHGSQDWWLAPGTGLPVRLVLVNDNATGSPIGEVRYRERVELRLVSLEPLR